MYFYSKLTVGFRVCLYEILQVLLLLSMLRGVKPLINFTYPSSSKSCTCGDDTWREAVLQENFGSIMYFYSRLIVSFRVHLIPWSYVLIGELPHGVYRSTITVESSVGNYISLWVVFGVVIPAVPADLVPPGIITGRVSISGKDCVASLPVIQLIALHILKYICILCDISWSWVFQLRQCEMIFWAITASVDIIIHVFRPLITCIQSLTFIRPENHLDVISEGFFMLRRHLRWTGPEYGLGGVFLCHLLCVRRFRGICVTVMIGYREFFVWQKLISCVGGQTQILEQAICAIALNSIVC